ncbi:MAG: hypothetical protein LBH71_00090 [Oscillospiraceae bacterium]|nr:hypothetical protein [Oscillospiraceae bacterium]
MQDIIVAANALITTFKELKELSEKADNVKLKTHILTMNEQILNMKEIGLEYRDENITLKEEIKRLTSFEGRELKLKNRAYYDKDNHGPYCPNCYDNDRQLILMAQTGVIFRYQCRKCEYGIK